MQLPRPLSHAYIITGGNTASRAQYARRLAAAYVCDGASAPCGVCRHCEKTAAGIHPDIIFLSPAEGKKEILVDQARALRADAYVRPNEAQRKVYAIDPADSMIRIAPSLPPIEELEKAMQVFCTCLQLAALEKILEN